MPSASPDEEDWFTKWKVGLCYVVIQTPGKSANYGFPIPAVKHFELTKNAITFEYQEGKRVTSTMRIISLSANHLLIETDPRDEVVNGTVVSWPAMNYEFRACSDENTVTLVVFGNIDKLEKNELPNSNGLLREGNRLYVLHKD